MGADIITDIVTDLPLELRRRLGERGYLLADGAMGTRLMEAGLAEGALPERWNRDRADDVVAIHASYIEAGSDIVLTNSFGGNRARLAMHGAEGELEELNMAAVACVRRAIERSGERAVFVAGSMGPTGEMLAPLGKMSEVEMEAMYYEQACALVKGGADMLWIETQSDLGEARCAMRAAARTGLPYSVTVSFDTAGSTMMGISPEVFVDFCLGVGEGDTSSVSPLVAPWGMGLNCGLAASDTLLSLRRLTGYLRSKRGDKAGDKGCDKGDDMLVIVKGNCGVPQWRDGGFRYSGDEGMMGDYAVLARRLGADVVGSCCGSGAGHVRVMGERLGDYGGGGIPSDEEIEGIVGRAEGAVVGGGIDAPKERRDREERRRRRGEKRRD